MSLFFPNLYKGIILKSRIRLARNINSYPFFIEDEKVAESVIKKVYSALAKADTFNLYYGSKLSDLELQNLKEKHIISSAFIENRSRAGALVNSDQSISLMINEEDVIREQCFMKGLKLSEAYQRLNKIDDVLIDSFDIAYDERFGFLTACPTNLGTGLRASVMLFLPALTKSGKIPELVSEMKNLGMTVRGVCGEGSRSEGYTYQISNEITLGVSESEIIESVSSAVEAIVKAERDGIEKMFKNNKIQLTDAVYRSYGILTNALLMTFSEYTEHIGNVKLGAMLKLIEIDDIESIDDLTEEVKDAVICINYGKKLTDIARQLYRAEAVKYKLKKLRR